MAEQEGVIKYTMQFTQTSPFPSKGLHELNAWRKILYLTQLIGQDPARYEGYGFGNISQRVGPFEENQPPHQRRFMISGTQTGNLAELKAEHYACVLECHPEQNRVVAEGPVRPSSESMTHGMLYALDDRLRFVMHAHSPEIWRQASALGLAMTDEHVPYGSPEMAGEVARLFREEAVQEQGIFGMAGHEDGIITFGKSAQEAGGFLLNYLARSFAL